MVATMIGKNLTVRCCSSIFESSKFLMEHLRITCSATDRSLDTKYDIYIIILYNKINNKYDLYKIVVWGRRLEQRGWAVMT